MTERPPRDVCSPDDDEPEPYKVGPGRPPLRTRFKKGQSGNPGGRRKVTLDYAAVLQAALEQPVLLKGGGHVTALEAILRVQVKNGLGGNRRAIEDLLDRLERFERRRAKPRADVDDTEQDRLILERALQRRSGRPPNSDGGIDDAADDDDEAGDD